MLLLGYVLMPMFALVNNIVSCAREMYLVYEISKYCIALIIISWWINFYFLTIYMTTIPLNFYDCDTLLLVTLKYHIGVFVENYIIQLLCTLRKWHRHTFWRSVITHKQCVALLLCITLPCMYLECSFFCMWCRCRWLSKTTPFRRVEPHLLNLQELSHIPFCLMVPADHAAS